MLAFIAVNFRSAHAGRSCAYLQIDIARKLQPFPIFCLTKQKGSVVLLLLVALQSNSTNSVLTNDGALGAGIKELKPGVAAPTISKSWPLREQSGPGANINTGLSLTRSSRFYPITNG